MVASMMGALTIGIFVMILPLDLTSGQATLVIDPGTASTITTQSTVTWTQTFTFQPITDMFTVESDSDEVNMPLAIGLGVGLGLLGLIGTLLFCCCCCCHPVGVITPAYPPAYPRAGALYDARPTNYRRPRPPPAPPAPEPFTVRMFRRVFRRRHHSPEKVQHTREVHHHHHCKC